ncbi:hypothetical protein GCM10027448_32890 [Nocardioides dilutus]
MEPGDADPVAGREPVCVGSAIDDAAHDLVARHHPRPAGLEVAFGEVQVGAAQAADVDVHQDLVAARLRDRAGADYDRALRHGSGSPHSP